MPAARNIAKKRRKVKVNLHRIPLSGHWLNSPMADGSVIAYKSVLGDGILRHLQAGPCNGTEFAVVPEVNVIVSGGGRPAKRMLLLKTKGTA